LGQCITDLDCLLASEDATIRARFVASAIAVVGVVTLPATILAVADQTRTATTATTLQSNCALRSAMGTVTEEGFVSGISLGYVLARKHVIGIG
jgi:hypothetical protein